MPPSARVSVSKGGCEEAVVVSEGASGDMANRIMLGEHGATEECLVVCVKRDGLERGRCGERLAMHHRMRGGAVIEMRFGEFVRSVIGTFRVSVRGRLEADVDPPGPERVDLVGSVTPLLDGCFRVRCGVRVCVGRGRVARVEVALPAWDCGTRRVDA